MNRTWLPASAALAASLGLAAPLNVAMIPTASAQTERMAQDKPADGSPLADLAAARRLFERGQRTGDALLMAAAARVAAGFQAVEGSAVKREGGAGAAGQHIAPAAGAMLDAAAAAAKDNPALAAIIGDAAKAGARASARETKYGTLASTLEGKKEESFTWEVKAGIWLDVGVDGDGKTDLDLYVYDPTDRMICAAENDGDLEYCSVYTRRDGAYKIWVVNIGEEPNSYELYWPE